MSHLAADKRQQRHAGNQGQGAFSLRERDTSLIIEEVVMWDPSALRFMLDNNWFTWCDASCLDGDGAAVKQITRGLTFGNVVLTPAREAAWQEHPSVPYMRVEWDLT